jgi:hypothetical protein
METKQLTSADAIVAAFGIGDGGLHRLPRRVAQPAQLTAHQIVGQLAEIYMQVGEAGRRQRPAAEAVLGGG